MNKDILIIDDDSLYIEIIKAIIEQKTKYTYDYATNLNTAQNLLENNKYKLLITDYQISSNKTGFDLILENICALENTNIIIITGHQKIINANLKIQVNNKPLYIIQKPFQPICIYKLINQLTI